MESSNKRQCVRQNHPHSGRSPFGNNNSVIGIDVIGLDVLTKCWSFLNISDINSASLTCTEWRHAICSCTSLWEGLIVQKYESHKCLPDGWCTSGRAEYFRRISLMKYQYMPVRHLAGLPIPLQRKTPGEELMQRWKPDAIVFMVDVFTGRSHFDDDIRSPTQEPTDPRNALHSQVPILSSFVRIPSSDNVDPDDTECVWNLDDECVQVMVEEQLDCKIQKATVESIEKFHDAILSNNDRLEHWILDEDGLYVEISYFVEGRNVPRCEPIILLSEHHTYTVNQENGLLTYRTDVDRRWLPGGNDSDDSEEEYEKEEMLSRARILTRQISKYSSVPLPFDPDFVLILSPPGERSMHHILDDDNDPIFEGDSKKECTIYAQIGFAKGEHYDCDFSKMVVPPLLSLWNDSSTNK